MNINVKNLPTDWLSKAKKAWDIFKTHGKDIYLFVQLIEVLHKFFSSLVR